MWCIWRERNWRTFEDMDKSDYQLLASFSGSLFEWSWAWGLTSSDSLPLFLSSLLCNQPFLSVCFFFCTLCSTLCFFCLRQLFDYTSFLLIKKKKKKRKQQELISFLCPHPTSPMPTMWELENSPKRWLQVLSMW